MRKLFSMGIVLFSILLLTGCSSKTTLYILNWGEYIDYDLVEAFEEEFDVKVKYSYVDSNEAMYLDISNNVAPYDIIVPSDYMIEKLSKENLLKEIDFDLLSNYTEGMYTTGLDTLIENCGYDDYFIPYFWGSLGIMYRTDKQDVVDAVTTNGFSSLFNQPTNSRVAMYDVSRDAFAAGQMHLGYDINSTNDTELQAVRDLIKSTSFHMWGTDDIKREIALGNADYGLVYSGDYFDQLYVDTENGKDINYSIYAPTDYNNVFFDAMCIPTTSRQTELAHEFINFMIDHENSLTNSYYVGYCPTIQTVYEEFTTDIEMEFVWEIPAFHPLRITQGVVYKDLGSTVYTTVEDYFYQAKAK